MTDRSSWGTALPPLPRLDSAESWTEDRGGSVSGANSRGTSVLPPFNPEMNWRPAARRRLNDSTQIRADLNTASPSGTTAIVGHCVPSQHVGGSARSATVSTQNIAVSTPNAQVSPGDGARANRDEAGALSAEDGSEEVTLFPICSQPQSGASSAARSAPLQNDEDEETV